MRSCVHIVRFLRGGPRTFELARITQRFSQGELSIAHICMLRATALTEHLGGSLERLDRLWIFSRTLRAVPYFTRAPATSGCLWRAVAHFDSAFENAFGFLWTPSFAHRMGQMEFDVYNVKVVIVVDGTQQLASLPQFLFCYEVLASSIDRFQYAYGNLRHQRDLLQRSFAGCAALHDMCHELPQAVHDAIVRRQACCNRRRA